MSAWIVPALTLPQGVHVVTTLRHGLGESASPFNEFNLGLRSGDEAAVVQRNRQALADALHLPSLPHWLNQVHGTDVHRFSAVADVDAAEQVADAAVTSVPGVVLSVLTADCLPVALVAKNGQEVAVAHAGWRGLVAGVLERSVKAMATAPDALVAWLGPAAGPCIYEVGEEVRDAFLAADAAASACFRETRPGHWRIDLYGIAKQRLNAIGVSEIYGGDRCTISESEAFFSHRRDARTGRMATLVWMDP